MRYLTLGFQGSINVLIEINCDLGEDIYIEDFHIIEDKKIIRYEFESDSELELLITTEADEYLIWKHLYNSLAMDFFISDSGKITPMIL